MNAFGFRPVESHQGVDLGRELGDHSRLPLDAHCDMDLLHSDAIEGARQGGATMRGDIRKGRQELERQSACGVVRIRMRNGG